MIAITRGAELLVAVLLLLPVFPAQARDVPGAEPEALGLSAERLARVDRVLQGYVNENKLAGAVVLVGRNGKIGWLRAFGNADIENRRPMQTDSLFRIYSMTKPVTSVALLMLYEEGHFQLSDPVEMHIPAFRDLKVFAGVDEHGRMILEDQKRKMTVHDLFRHTAGFAYGFSDSPVDRAYAAAGVGYSGNSLKSLVEKLATVPLAYQPGTQWMYSFAHDVQAYLVEHFSGMAFDRFLRERMFEPLGMKDTSFALTAGKRKRLAHVYGPVNPPPGLASFMPLESGLAPYTDPTETDLLKEDNQPLGGIGLVSTAEDYFRFAQMLVNGGELNGRRILGRKTVELMTMNHVPPGVPGILAPGSGYGLGVSSLVDVAASGSPGSVGQFGWGGAATTSVIMDPKEQFVAILMAQHRPMNFPLTRQFHTLVYQAITE
jgi:CubicO group peptidase (beta-lactamase class C family)